MRKESNRHLFHLVTGIFPEYHAELSGTGFQPALTYNPLGIQAQDYLRFSLSDGLTLTLYLPQDDLGMAEQIKKMVISLIETLTDRERLLDHVGISQDNVSFLTTRLFNPAGTESLAHVVFSGLSMGYDLTIPRRVCVLDIRALETDRILRESTLRSILYAIRSFSKNSSQDLAVQVTNSRIVLCRQFEGNGSRQRSQAIGYCSRLCAYLMDRFQVSIRVGVGSATKSISDFSTSLVQAQSALKYARIFPDGQTVHFYEDYIFEEEFSRMPPKMLAHFLESYCIHLDAQPLLAETLEALVIHNMDMAAAANALYVHRNTVVFRINQMKRLFRLNPLHNDSDRFTLISIYIYYKLSRHGNSDKSQE